MVKLAGPRDIAAAWQPQVPGSRKPRDVPDALVEPEWGGVRVIAALSADDAALFSRGEEVPVPEELTQALLDAFRAVEAVVEGRLTTKALESSEGAFPPTVELERPPLVVPRGLVRNVKDDPYLRTHERRKQELVSEVRVLEALDEGERHAFVATDLLWLDGQPLHDIPLLERKRLLETVFEESGLVRITAFVKPAAVQTLVTWGALGFAELSYRAANSRYLAGRENPDWAVASPPKGPGSAQAGPAGPR